MNKFINRNIEELSEISFLAHYLYKIEGFIAGGCFKNIFTKQPIKDIDIFFKNKQDFDDAVELYSKREKTQKIFENDKCIGFKDKSTGMQIELVRSTFGTMEEVINRFDFTITKFAYKRKFLGFDEDESPMYEHTLVHHKDFFQHLAMKRLVLDNEPNEIFFPFSTFDRMFRYQKYGYAPCRESKVKIINAIRLQEEFNNDEISKSLYESGWD